MIELWHNSVQLRADHIRSWLRIGPGFQKSSEDFGGFTGKIREGQGKRFFLAFCVRQKCRNSDSGLHISQISVMCNLSYL